MFRLLNIIIAFLLISLAGEAAFARQRTEVKVISNDKYIRLFFYCKQPAIFETSLNGNKLKVHFGSDVAIDVTSIQAIGNDINDVVFNESNNTATIILATNSYSIRKFLGEDFIGVDIIKPENTTSAKIIENSALLPKESESIKAEKGLNEENPEEAGIEPAAGNNAPDLAMVKPAVKPAKQVKSKPKTQPKLRQVFVETAEIEPIVTAQDATPIQAIPTKPEIAAVPAESIATKPAVAVVAPTPAQAIPTKPETAAVPAKAVVTEPAIAAVAPIPAQAIPTKPETAAVSAEAVATNPVEAIVTPNSSKVSTKPEGEAASLEPAKEPVIPDLPSLVDTPDDSGNDTKTNQIEAATVKDEPNPIPQAAVPNAKNVDEEKIISEDITPSTATLQAAANLKDKLLSKIVFETV